MTKRILITGSRNWDDKWKLEDILDQWAAAYVTIGETDVILVSGACPTGADRLAEEEAVKLGMTVERHPADWNKHGKSAGFIRNQEMVNLGADVCLAFIKDGSKGATHTLNAARKAGILSFIWRD